MPCSVEECLRPVKAKGYCSKHYERWFKHGNPLDATRPGGPRKYFLDEDFFEHVDSPEKAYWLGFIAADGGVDDYTTYGGYTLKVELAAGDHEHLAKLRDALGSNRPFYYRDPKVVRGYLSSGTVSAHFSSKKMIEDLDRSGIRPKKSAMVEPWNGPSNLMRHYWRGLFDGDGSLGTRNRAHRSPGINWFLNIVGSKFCVEAFASWASSFTKCNTSLHETKGAGCWLWSVEGGPLPQSIAEELYRDASIFLDRKKLLADILRAIDYEAVRASAKRRRAEFLRTAPRNSRGHILLSQKGGGAL